MKALITGTIGFAGSHLVEYLFAHQPQVEVFGIKRSSHNLITFRQYARHLFAADCQLCFAQRLLGRIAIPWIASSPCSANSRGA